MPNTHPATVAAFESLCSSHFARPIHYDRSGGLMSDAEVFGNFRERSNEALECINQISGRRGALSTDQKYFSVTGKP